MNKFKNAKVGDYIANRDDMLGEIIALSEVEMCVRWTRTHQEIFDQIVMFKHFNEHQGLADDWGKCKFLSEQEVLAYKLKL